MNIIPQTTTYQLQERYTSAIGVEYTAVTEPAGNDRDQAQKLFAERVAANPAAFAPTTGIRLVLLGGDR